MKKAISTLVSYVTVAAISVVAISIVLSIGLPAIDRAKDAALINEAKNIMQSIDGAARQVLFEGNGAQRVFSISSSGGDYFVEKDTDSIKFKLNSISGVIDPGTSRKEGNLLIVAGADVKAYEINYSADPSLVGYWKLDSVNGTNYTPDSSGYGNGGLLTNMNNTGNATSGSAAGMIGNGLIFDGINDFVNASGLSGMGVSVEYWKKNATDSGWYHIANSSGTLYVNGAAGSGQNVFVTNVSGNVVVGKDASGNFFNGTIDEVRIYNRSLSADEIRQHYYQGLKNLELGTNLVLENTHIAFETPKIGLPSAQAAINNSKLVEKITVKESGLNITPLDSSTILNGNALSANGTGYTQLAQTGDLLREASIKSYISSPSSGVNYEIWYTLRSNADFILEEIRNITLD